MTYDTWKCTDPEMERVGRLEMSIDNVVQAIGKIWMSWGLEPSIDTPDLDTDEMRGVLQDKMEDEEQPGAWTAEILMETYIEDIEGDGPYLMTVENYRKLIPAARELWRKENGR